jgi:hypothetical protein
VLAMEVNLESWRSMFTHCPEGWKNFFVYDSDFIREVKEIWTHGLAESGLEITPCSAGGAKSDSTKSGRHYTS